MVPKHGATKTEAEVRSMVMLCLQGLGWHVVSFSWHRRMPPTLKDYPDITAFHQDATLLVEAKVHGKRRTEGQMRFFRELEPRLGRHLMYACAREWEDVADVLEANGWPTVLGS